MRGVRLISDDEYVVVRTRTHAKALVWPAIGLVVLAGLTGAGAAAIPPGSRPVGQIVVVALGVLVVVWIVLRPFLRWVATTYTITTHRLISRRGIVHRVGHDIPLIRVHDVSYDQSLPDRMLRCGTIVVHTAADSGGIALVDVPEVRHVHAVLGELLFGSDAEVDHEPEWA